MSESNQRPSRDDLEDIQGNIVGFNKDHLRLLYLQLPSPDVGRQFLTAMLDEVDNAADVRDVNRIYKSLQKRKRDRATLETSWVNLLLSAAAVEQLDPAAFATFPAVFRDGMRAAAERVGDVDQSAPANWVGPFGPSSGFTVHAVVLIAADTAALLEERTANVRALIQSTGVTEFASPQEGQTRPEPFRAREHFGFRDGISQPSIAGVTKSSKGGDEIAAGEFLIGYEDQDGDVSGQPPAAQPVPQQGEPGYPPVQQPPPVQPMPDWCRNSSFAVLRRLRQDVAGFRSFLQTQASQNGLTPDQLSAKLVGRWPSGAPLEVVPGDHGADTTSSDPSAEHPSVLEDGHINHFGYHEHDEDGHLTPLAAHIRKSNPRDAENPGQAESNRHRILRRGIPYGAEFVETEPPYGATGPQSDGQDRGLLFLCYQASIERGFEFIQSHWANRPDFPTTDAGQDPIISQNTAQPPFTIQPSIHLMTQRWVITTGGDYYFAPSLQAIKHLGGGS